MHYRHKKFGEPEPPKPEKKKQTKKVIIKNASENSLVLDKTPITLNLAGEWWSSKSWSLLAWGVEAEHQTWINVNKLYYVKSILENPFWWI